MKYPIPTLSTPVDPILLEWVDSVPERFRRKAGLMDFLLRIVHRIYDGKDGIPRNSGVNPFYKIIELLSADKLYYSSLQTIKQYYHFDIIRYLTEGNIAENYVGYPCYDARQLKSALSPRRNITNGDTLTSILSNIV